MTVDNTEPTKWPPFNPFVRHPTFVLGKLRMVLFSPLVPVRVLGAICTLGCGLMWCYICTIGCDTSKPYPPLRRRLLLGGLCFASRTLLFFYGAYHRMMYYKNHNCIYHLCNSTYYHISHSHSHYL